MSTTTKPTKTEDDDGTTTTSTTVNNPQWNNVESIFKSPSSNTATTTIDNNGSSGLPMRKSPPRFLGKRNRNTSFDQQGGGSIKKTLSWALPTDDLHTNTQDKASSSSSYVAPPVNPSRSPIIEDDDDDDDDDETFPIKFSLSNDYSTKDETCSLSEYLTDANFSISMMGPSPRGSPTMTSFFEPGDVFPMEGGDGSPLLNIHGSDTFDFCDTNTTKSFLESPPTIKNSSSCLSDQVASASSAAAAAAAASHVHHELPPPRLPVGDGLISRSHSSDCHHSTTSQYNLSPRKSSNNDSPYRHHQEVHHGGGSGNGGPMQHLSPGQTIYNVASKSVGSPSTPYYHSHQQQNNNWNHHSSESHSTPLTTASVSSETSPEFNPPRSNLRESKYQATITVSTPHGNDDKSSMKNDDGSLKTKHVASSSSSSSGGKIVTDPITPSPSGGTHNNIRQAISDESSSPTEMAPTVHHPPPHRPYHHHPSSGGGGSGSYGGGGGYNNIDHHRGSHHQRWSDSLHMAPLPPYVQQQHHHQSHHAHHHHPWQQQQAPGQQLNLPPALPSSGRGGGGGGGLGYHHHNHHRHPPATTSYSGPYYHQATPDRATSSIATPSTTTVPPSSLPNSNSQEQVVNNASTTAAVKEEEEKEEHAYWNKHYHLLHQFLLQYGHCNIPPNYGIGTHYETLYDWCVNQRAEYQKMCRYNSGGGGEEKEEGRSTMTPTRVRILTSMGFVWGAPLPPGRGTGTSHGGGGSRSSSSNKKSSSSSSYSSNWDKWIEMLKSFKSQHGHVDVPLKYEPNPALGTFVNRQRSEYRKYHTSKPTSITPQRISQLNTLGFTWSIRDTHTSWNERYNELTQFRNVNGHTNVPKIYNQNPSLGYWVNEQRFQYRRLIKNKSSSMNEEKIRLLNELDFKWSLRETNGSWDNWIKELKGYKSQHGDVDVPLKYKHNPALGAFVNRQRTEYRKLQQGLQSSLTQDRMASLNELDFKWTMRVSRTPWETRLDELIKFKEQHGHCNVPSTYPLNQPLAYWVFKQRGQYRIWQKRDYVVPGEKKQMCHMTPDRIRKLDEIGFEWNPPRRIK